MLADIGGGLEIFVEHLAALQAILQQACMNGNHGGLLGLTCRKSVGRHTAKETIFYAKLFSEPTPYRNLNI